MKQGRLGYGVCRSFFYNSADRVRRLKSKRRPCYMAYCGYAGTYRSKRFMIDTLGERAALAGAIRWRRRFAPMDVRTCDIARRRRNAAKRACAISKHRKTSRHGLGHPRAA